jgi:hypothetical protein
MTLILNQTYDNHHIVIHTRVCAASGERGFPSSQTTWSATNSTTPAPTMVDFLMTFLVADFKHLCNAMETTNLCSSELEVLASVEMAPSHV